MILNALVWYYFSNNELIVMNIFLSHLNMKPIQMHFSRGKKWLTCRNYHGILLQMDCGQFLAVWSVKIKKHFLEKQIINTVFLGFDFNRIWYFYYIIHNIYFKAVTRLHTLTPYIISNISAAFYLQQIVRKVFLLFLRQCFDKRWPQ